MMIKDLLDLDYGPLLTKSLYQVLSTGVPIQMDSQGAFVDNQVPGILNAVTVLIEGELLLEGYIVLVVRVFEPHLFVPSADSFFEGDLNVLGGFVVFAVCVESEHVLLLLWRDAVSSLLQYTVVVLEGEW
jgi:hypothetical protein